MHTKSSQLPVRPASRARDGAYREFYQNSTAPCVNTNEVIVEALRKQYPELHLTVSPTYSSNLLAYAASGHAQAIPIDEDENLTENLKWRLYRAPTRRMDGDTGFLYDSVQFGKYIYKWREEEFILYNVNGGDMLYKTTMTYLLGTSASNDALLLEAAKFFSGIHNEVLVFDQGYWQASRELWEAVQHANWEEVILDEEMKKSLTGEVTKFFNSEERYHKLRVPWKRGLIYYGPPGNGKTISIKAIMHSLYSLPDPIPTLYVRSLSSYGGPEYSVYEIFRKARQQAPCLLVFEDLDSIVSDSVRSYFLNEVDGLQANDGILMIGSTNHLDRLDPGIRKRPSRFDRKYLFPDPDRVQRVQYCRYWRRKLLDGDDGGGVEFPARLCNAIAGITGGFSFAYTQEAFVAALLAIANEDGDDNEMKPLPLSVRDDEDLEQYILWREMKKVIKTLREELDPEKKDSQVLFYNDMSTESKFRSV